MNQYFDNEPIEYIPLEGSIEIIFDSPIIELWDLSIINLSLHRIINYVGYQLLEDEYGKEYTNELRLALDDIGKNNIPYSPRVPRLVQTQIKSVSNGSIHQLIELGVAKLNNFTTKQPFIASVVASLAAAVIYSIASVTTSKAKITSKQKGPRKVIDIGPNLRKTIISMSKDQIKRKRKIIIKSGDDEVTIEF